MKTVRKLLPFLIVGGWLLLAAFMLFIHHGGKP